MDHNILAKKTSLYEASSLFERLGGETAVRKIVEGMYQKIFSDPDTAEFFRKTDKAHQTNKMVAFFVYTLGGADDWEGKSMKEVHQGRGLTPLQFERMIEHVRSTMIENSIIEELITETLE